jgi:hypothetical protein
VQTDDGDVRVCWCPAREDFLLGNVAIEALVVADVGSGSGGGGGTAAGLAGGDHESFAHMEEDVVRMCR